MKKKYLNEEERKEAIRKSYREWYQKNKEKRLEQKKQYSKANKAKIAEYHKQWYQANREKMLEQMKQWREANREKRLEQMKQYNKTPIGRARYLVSGYNQKDRKANRGECTLTAKWMIDNIFTQKCIYCGESDWKKLGCDRINNSLPHTEDNVVPCCEECNKKRGSKPYEEFLAEIKKGCI